jgi:hypothetical protein
MDGARAEQATAQEVEEKKKGSQGVSSSTKDNLILGLLLTDCNLQQPLSCRHDAI